MSTMRPISKKLAATIMVLAAAVSGEEIAYDWPTLKLADGHYLLPAGSVVYVFKNGSPLLYKLERPKDFKPRGKVWTTDKPTQAFRIGVDDNFIVGAKVPKDLIFHKDKAAELDKLISLKDQSIKNLETTIAAMVAQMDIERAAVKRQAELFDRESKVAGRSIDELKMNRWRSALLSFGLGAVAGGFWAEGDGSAEQWLKIAGMGFGGGYVSWYWSR